MNHFKRQSMFGRIDAGSKEMGSVGKNRLMDVGFEA
jgi:hypothetical protein